MGIIADLLANAKSIETNGPVYNWLESRRTSKVDPAVPTAAAAANAVLSLSTATMTSGNFTLTFNLASGESFTTANIAFNAAAATIETAVDSAATAASIAGWTNGDISVAGGAVNVAPVTFTFDGTSVISADQNISLTDVDGAGGSWGTISKTTSGQSTRNALGTLEVLGALSGTYADQLAAYDPDTPVYTLGDNFQNLPSFVLIGLAREAVEEDNNWRSYWTLMNTLKLTNERAPAQAQQGPVS